MMHLVGIIFEIGSAISLHILPAMVLTLLFRVALLLFYGDDNMPW